MGNYLIIGSGISGCTAAEALANQGHQVELIEASNVIGGAILEYACKATDECSRCGVCVAHTQLYQTLNHPRVTTSLGTSISSVRNRGKTVDVTLTRKNPTITYSKCLCCDHCVNACPTHCITRWQRGEFVQYVIDYAACLLHQGQSCSVCADRCPTQAIFAHTAQTETTITADAALIATGHEPYNASQKIRLGYGRTENVLTGVEVEEILGRQTYLRNPADSIAFIQCVGSRDPHIGRNYCSSVCCAYALRLARVMKYRHPETPVTIYYIDIQNFDKTFTLFRKSVEDSGVRFVRGVPFSVERSNTGKLKLYIENIDGEESIVEHDIVVLSVGMGPTAEAKTVASLFGLKRDAFGFFSSPLPNVFVSGTCQEPLSIPDSMATARAIALAMGKMQPGNGGHLSGQTVMNRPPNKTQADPQSIRPVQKAIKVLPEATSFDTRKVLLQQRVLVIGGGMAGITTAQELHCFGYPIAVIEQTEEIGDSGKMDGVEVFSRSSLLELTGNIGNFSVRIKTSEGDKTIPCGAVVLASGSRVPETVSTSSQMFAIADIEMALADLVKRRGIRAIGLILDLEIDETKASTEMALQLAKRIQQMQRYQTYLFCRDVRVAAKDLELLYDEARDAGVNIIKYAGKLSLSETEKGICITYTDSILNQTMTVYCDRIGISPCGISVSADAHLASITGVSTDGYGQFQDNNIHLFAEHTNRPGIFVVGSCRGQHYIPQILAEARATALEIHALLSPKYLEVELSNAVVDPDKCVLCLTCIRSCPHKAMQINRTQGAAESLPEVCQKCGICAGECPAKAIELPVYSDCVILKQVTE